jgi:hydantoinase/carbamoylase family amidase
MMDISAIRVQEERLRKDLEELGKFGEEPGGGLMRTALSDSDLEARQWLRKRMEEADLQVREDAAANLIGRLDLSSSPGSRPCIAVGSHLDAVSHGGKFDGALGICAGLEALRAVQESGLSLPYPLELLAFTDEEGVHFAGTFGSRAMFNLLTEGEIFRTKGPDRPSLAQSLERMGKDPKRIGHAVRSPAEFRAFVELHIEQGPVLDSLGVPIGIVEGIVSIDRYRLEVTGRAGHAGTTPMHQRDDALVKAARLIMELDKIFRSAGPGLVGTIGELKVHPGAFNIIPGKVEMSLDLRSEKKAHLPPVRQRIAETAKSLGRVRIEKLLTKGGVDLDPEIMEMIELSCRERGLAWTRMRSGAGHDAMTFPELGIPTGMIFVPCVKGVSHCPEEAIRWEDASAGAQILADTIVRIAHGA